MGSSEKKGRLKLICLNAVQYAIYIVYSLIGIPLCTIYVLVTSLFSTRRRTLYRVRRLIVFWAIGLSFVTLPFVKVYSKSNNKSCKTGPCIYVCNHRSFLDGFLMSHPCRKHEVIEIVNIWPFRIPVIGLMARLAGYLNVNAMSFKDFSDKAQSLLEEGVSLVAFPEGTRSKGKVTGTFHSSTFRIALETGCPIVPVCISGTETVLPRGNVMLRPGLIKIHELPAVHGEQYKGITPFNLKQMVHGMIVQELFAMDGGK